MMKKINAFVLEKNRDALEISFCRTMASMSIFIAIMASSITMHACMRKTNYDINVSRGWKIHDATRAMNAVLLASLSLYTAL